MKVCLAVKWEVAEVAICLWSSKSNSSFWAVCAFIVIYVSSIFYMGIEVPVFACMSQSSVASGHSMLFICSTVRLVSVSNFPEHSFEWLMCPITGFVAVACHVQSISHHVSSMVESLTRQEQCEHAIMFWLSSWVSSMRFPETLLGRFLPGQVSADPFHVGHTVQLQGLSSQHQCKGAICLLFPLYGYQLWFLVGFPSISGAEIRKVLVTICIQFISLVVAYSSLPAAAVICLIPYA